MKPFFLLISILIFTSCAQHDWKKADRSSVGLAPDPKVVREAVVQVYAARAVKWRGIFAVHSWIATKEKDAEHYTSYHVMGFRLKRTSSSVVIKNDLSDRRWYGAMPILIDELRGEKAEAAIPKIKTLVENYPYKDQYRVWPGPNSNTFISHIIRNVDELGVELPPHAIGKDWINQGDFFAKSESGTGFQFSFFGALGLTLGLAEGIEVNILGLNFGLDFYRPALKLPFIGRLGFDDAPVF